MHAPDFWRRRGWLPTVLAPAGLLYSAGGWLRETLVSPSLARVPVICIGNAVAGGAGKTPTLLAVASLLANRSPHALSRGYRGRLPGPLRVNPVLHGAADVGDEPLLLANHLPSWVARDRVAGARTAANSGASLILLDDGLQDPALVKTASLLVVDSDQGFGNGLCLPAGPLREPAARALARADAVVLIGDGSFPPPQGKPAFRARIIPRAQHLSLAGRRVVAFAGIGRPEKFFATLRDCGADLVAAHAFADHHVFTEADLTRIVAGAAEDTLVITTEKDHVRLTPEWRDRIAVLEVFLRFDDPTAVRMFLNSRLALA
jgi:tetraacyldisaccharide 4'-kinase